MSNLRSMDIREVASQYRLFTETIRSKDGKLTSNRVQLFEDYGQLVRTFTSVSFDSPFSNPPTTAGEWNPFSQRPVLFAPPTQGTFFGEAFESARQALTSVVIAMHGIFHVLLLEPFFTGKLNFGSRSQFEEFMRLSEAYCFFFSDIILTRGIRARYPDGEPVFSRSAVSQSTFHPYQAFEALGVRDERRILRIYLDAFLGRETRLVTGIDKSIFISDLSSRLYLFYGISTKPIAAFYKYLSGLSLFDEYFQRFCRKDGIPCLPVFATGKVKHGVSYFLEVDRLRKTLAKLPEGRVEQVWARRLIQTRAYYGLQLRRQLERREVVVNARNLPYEKVLGALEDYLSQLESSLEHLCQGRPISAVVRAVRLADATYNRLVRGPLRNSKAWSARREFIYPAHRPNIICSRFDFLKRLSEKQRLELTEFLEEQIWKSQGSTSEKWGLLRELSRVRKLKNPERGARILLSVMNHPRVLGTWSKPLDGINPGKNLFLESSIFYA